MEEMRHLINSGIKYEDEFIDLYMKVIRDEGFLYLFGSNQAKAKELLSQLIQESNEHKQILEKIISQL